MDISGTQASGFHDKSILLTFLRFRKMSPGSCSILLYDASMKSSFRSPSRAGSVVSEFRDRLRFPKSGKSEPKMSGSSVSMLLD